MFMNFAGSILQVEPKRLGSGYPPERHVGLASLNQPEEM
jgi:hypothetical protein